MITKKAKDIKVGDRLFKTVEFGSKSVHKTSVEVLCVDTQSYRLVKLILSDDRSKVHEFLRDDEIEVVEERSTAEPEKTGLEHISTSDWAEFTSAFTQVALGAYSTAASKGFHDNWNDGEKLMLVVAEVSELVEELREDNLDKQAVLAEMADVIIRMMDFAIQWTSRNNLDPAALGRAIRDKMIKNTKRPAMHGKKF